MVRTDFVAVVLAFICSSTAIVVSPTGDATILANALLGQGLTLVNATYTGNAAAAGTYTNGPLSITNGVVLTSGSAAAVANAQSTSASTGWGTAGSPLCAGVSPGTYYDSALLSMYVQLDLDSYNGLSTHLIFGSDEYPQYVGSSFNDVVGIYFDGVQFAFDSAGKPVNINNGFFASGTVNTNTGTVYGGSTPLLTVNSPDLSTTDIHRIDIVVCDSGDSSLDSGALISAFGGVACPGTCVGGATLSGPVLKLSAASDSGISNTDGITNSPSLAIDVSADANKVITFYMNDTTIGTMNSGSTGKFSYFLPENLPYGDITFSSSVVSGTKTATSTPIIIKYRPYATSSIAVDLDESSDTGVTGDLITSASSLSITGSFIPNTALTVKMDQAEDAQVTTGKDGSFTFTSGSFKTQQGLVIFTITGADVAGNSVSATLGVTVAPKPASPQLGGLSSGSDTGTIGDLITSNTIPTIVGTAPANSIVKVYSQGVLVGSGQSTDNGAFSIPVLLVDGANELFAVAETTVDTSEPSQKLIITVHSSQAVMPSKLTLDDDSDTGNKGDSITTNQAPSIGGNGQPGQVVHVYNSIGLLIATTTVDENGLFEVTLPPMEDGSYEFYAVAVDSEGNPSDPSDLFKLTIRASQAITPQGMQLDSATTFESPSQTLHRDPSIVGLLPNAVNGSSTPAALTITFILDGFTYTTMAADTDKFTYQPQGLALGSHSLVAYTTDADGNVSPDSTSYTFDIVTVDLAVAVGSANSSSNATTVSSSNSNATVSDPASGPAAMQTTGPLPSFSGKAIPGSTLMLILDNVTVAEVVTDVHGLWSYQAQTPMTAGVHLLSMKYAVTPMYATGNEVAAVSFLVVVPATSTTSESATSTTESSTSTETSTSIETTSLLESSTTNAPTTSSVSIIVSLTSSSLRSISSVFYSNTTTTTSASFPADTSAVQPSSAGASLAALPGLGSSSSSSVAQPTSAGASIAVSPVPTPSTSVVTLLETRTITIDVGTLSPVYSVIVTVGPAATAPAINMPSGGQVDSGNRNQGNVDGASNSPKSSGSTPASSDNQTGSTVNVSPAAGAQVASGSNAPNPVAVAVDSSNNASPSQGTTTPGAQANPVDSANTAQSSSSEGDSAAIVAVPAVQSPGATNTPAAQSLVTIKVSSTGSATTATASPNSAQSLPVQSKLPIASGSANSIAPAFITIAVATLLVNILVV